MWVNDRKPPMGETVLAKTKTGIYAICRHTPEFCWAFTGEYENLLFNVNLIEEWKLINSCI